MPEPKQIQVGDTTYELLPWSYPDGRKWFYRLLKAVAGAVDGSLQVNMAGLVAVLDAVDEAMFVALCEVIEKYTMVVRDADGKTAKVQLSKVAGEHMRGRHFDLAALIKAHLEAEFSDFFDRVGELLPAESAEEKK